jgi:hypothetical protein
MMGSYALAMCEEKGQDATRALRSAASVTLPPLYSVVDSFLVRLQHLSHIQLFAYR